MSVSNFKSGGKKIGHVSQIDQLENEATNQQKKETISLPIEEGLKKINLQTVDAAGCELPKSGIHFCSKTKTTSASRTTTTNHFGSINQNGVANFRLDQISKHIAEGTFSQVVDTVTQPKFIKEAYARADAAGKAEIKVMAAIAIAAHGEEIAAGLRKNDGINELKDVPEHHIADVMKMSMQFGASQRSMNAFMNFLHEAGKLPAVIEHVFKDTKSSDLINITSSIVKLGLDPTPLTCAQTAFRLMSYALDHAGIQKNSQPVLFKFVSTLARGFQLGGNILEVAGNMAGFGMLSQVSSFLIQRIRDYAMRQQTKADQESMQFMKDIDEMQKKHEAQSEKDRAENFAKKEEERSVVRGRIREAIILEYKNDQSRESGGMER